MRIGKRWKRMRAIPQAHPRSRRWIPGPNDREVFVRPRLFLLLALLAVVVVAAGAFWWAQSRPRPADVALTPAVEPDRRIDFSKATTKAELEAVLESAYRLPPDRRMTGALGQLSELLEPAKPVPEVRSEWARDRWSVTVGGAPAGALAALPGFADGLELAEGWARGSAMIERLPAGEPDGAAASLLAEAKPEQALVVLDERARRSGASLALIEQALVACTQLAMVLREDKSGYADTTSARALALLGLTRAAGRGPHTREQCALAWAMGYTEEATALAHTLPDADAIRMLVERRDAALRDAARQAGAPRETRVCDLLARVRIGDFEGWRAALDAPGRPGAVQSVTPLATALGFHRFDVSRAVGPVLVQAAFEDMLDAPERPRADSTTLAAFEHLLARPGIARRGPLAGGVLASARRALFYSGLFAWNEFVLDRFASPQLAKTRSRPLPADSGASYSWYARWQRDLARAANDENVGLPLRVDLEDPAVPPSFALTSYETLLEQMPVRDGVPARSATRVLAARLDSRPRYALEMAIAAQDHVRWPTLTERLLIHADRMAGNELPRATLLLATMRDDRARLGRMVTDPIAEPRVAMAALRTYVEADSAAAGSLLHWFAVVGERDPRDWALADAHADLLEARGRFAEAERVVWEWVVRSDSTQDALHSTIATTSLARLQRKQGRIPVALQTIGDLDRGEQRGAMEEKARLLALTGSLPHALMVARRSQERYPQRSEGLAFPAELYWLAGQDEAAAAYVAKLPPEPYEIKADVAACFGRVFGGRRDRIDHAIEALRRAVPSYALLMHWIVRELRTAGHLELAAKLAEHAHPGSGAERGFGIANTYQLIAKARGDAAAEAWLSRQTMDVPARALASGFFTIRGHAEEAWALEQWLINDEYGWLMRAAAWRMDGGRRASWADTLRSRVPEAGDGLYPRLTRYMLGEVGENEVLSAADSPKHRVEVWYHCGLQAWSEGRARDALLWMVLCMESGSVRDGEYIWAQSALANWCGALRVPEKLKIQARARI